MGMFCFQCQEAAGGKGCTVKGVCGKEPQTAGLMDVLIDEVIGAAIMNRTLREKGVASKEISHAILDALFCTITNANFDDSAIQERICNIAALKQNFNAENPHPSTGVGVLNEPNEDIRSLKQMIIYGVKGAAAYAEHALNLGHEDEAIYAALENALAEVSRADIGADELVTLTMAVGECGVKAMALLDRANTSTYGNPEITRVNIGVGSRPGILVSGHDLKDL